MTARAICFRKYKRAASLLVASTDGRCRTLTAYAAGLSNTWQTIPAFNRTDADVNLIALEFHAMSFQAPCDDPVFSAHIDLKLPQTSGEVLQFYNPDHYMAFIGCTQQHQICKNDGKTCTDLMGNNAILVEGSKLGLTSMQNATLVRLAVPAGQSDFSYSIAGRSAAALVASQTVDGQSQGPLPNDQWTLEVGSWFDTALALMQQRVQQYATGPPAVPPGFYMDTPHDEGDGALKTMCYSQLVQIADGTVNFSVLGLALILVLGTLIVVFSWYQESVVGWLQLSVFRRGEHARLHWILDDKFQLQRMAYELQGLGAWRNREGAVPVSEPGARFGAWEDICDPCDPRRSKMFGSVEGATVVEELKGQDTSYRGYDGSQENRPFMEAQRGPITTVIETV